MSHRRLAVLVAAVSACAPDAVFHCTSTQQCRANGQTGTCETSGFCSFPDPSCPSGSRYTDGDGTLASECVDVSSGVDRDDDGVPDAGDNCPDTANSDQGNEDGDVFGDACDPCPVDANNTPADSDTDGLADACDPHATMADHLILFEGFHHGVPAGWTMSGGTFMQSGDSLVIMPNPGARALLTIPFTTTKTITVSAAVSPVTLPPVTVEGGGGVVAATDSTDLVACVLDDKMGDQTVEAVETQHATSATQPWAFQVMIPYTLTATWDLATAVSCEVETNAVTSTAMLALPAALPATWHRLGVYAVAMPIRIDWVMVTSL
jgi:hypothetical protein